MSLNVLIYIITNGSSHNNCDKGRFGSLLMLLMDMIIDTMDISTPLSGRLFEFLIRLNIIQ